MKNITHERVVEARSRYLAGGEDGHVFGHIIDPVRGDLTFRLRVRGDVSRFEIGRTSQDGKLHALTLTIDEIGALVMAAASYRLMVSPATIDDDGRGRKRGRR